MTDPLHKRMAETLRDLIEVSKIAAMMDIWPAPEDANGPLPAAIAVLAQYDSGASGQGWQLVPNEPTQWMRTQGDEGFESGSVNEIWRRMLAAAPAAPGDEEGDSARRQEEGQSARRSLQQGRRY